MTTTKIKIEGRKYEVSDLRVLNASSDSFRATATVNGHRVEVTGDDGAPAVYLIDGQQAASFDENAEAMGTAVEMAAEKLGLIEEEE